MKKLALMLLALATMNCSSFKNKKNDTTKNKAVLAYKINAALGEGAIWNYKTKELYWIDIEGKSLNIYTPKTKKNRVLKTPSRIGTVVPSNTNEALIALEDGVYKIDLESAETTLFVDMKESLANRRLNDGKCDPYGRFWVGSMHFNQEKGKAKLYNVNANGTLEVKIDSVTISNGIVWTADKTTMYYIDTPTSQIKAYDYDNATGNISNAKIAIQIPTELGFPDGMTIDEEDMIWVGMWNGNAVIRFNPKTGEALQRIEVPAHNVTSCAFGGENLETLYITTARVDMSASELKKYPLAGSVFKVIPGAKGVKSSFFK